VGLEMCPVSEETIRAEPSLPMRPASRIMPSRLNWYMRGERGYSNAGHCTRHGRSATYA